jgi:phage putative head morphogenesis protein, SPP1 gp7 family
MIDSVFSRLLLSPEFPAASDLALQGMEDDAVAMLREILEDSIDAYLDQVMGLPLEEVMAQPLPQFKGQADPVLVVMWGQAFDLGAVDAIAYVHGQIDRELKAAGLPRIQALDQETLDIIQEAYDTVAPQLENLDALAAVIARVNHITGDWAEDVLAEVRGHVIASILPQVETGEPISREELILRIESTLEINTTRARVIARHETSYAYTKGRMASFNRVKLVDYVRVLVISDDRTTQICLSRQGLVVPKDGLDQIGGAPPYHIQCRTTLGAVMSRLPRFQAILDDPNSRPENRTLEPLPSGWVS